MRTLPLVLAAAFVCAAGALTFAATPPESSGQPGRYTMQPTDGGFLRLDTATGAVSLCSRTTAEFECRPVRDDLDLQAEIARLDAENKELRAEVKRLDDLLGLNGGAGREPKKFELPTEKDVDQALSYLERMFKKFREKLKEFDSQGGPGGRDGGSGKGTPL